MRIRKNANPSSLRFSSTVKSEVCQLNQSPWDVISLSPSNHLAMELPSSSFLNLELDKDDSFHGNGNGSLGDSLGGIESVEKPDFMVVETQDYTNFEEMKMDSDIGFEKRDKKKMKKSEVKYCSSGKGVTRRGGKSGRGSKKGTGSGSSSNPYEYYYYSGFGPRWAKRRGDKATSNGVEDGDGADNEENIAIKSSNIASSYPRIENDNNRADFGFFDEFEDDDEDDDELDNINGGGKEEKKRMRKPIKARSLKSLM